MGNMMNDKVKNGYNQIAQQYSAERDRFKNDKYLARLVTLLTPHAQVLDIGCGSGVPVDQYLVDKGFQLQGIDISEKQIELARLQVPQAEFRVADMEKLNEGEYKVDAVVSFYAIFHIKKEKHKELFNKIGTFLPHNGLFLVTMGTSEWEGSEEFHGTTMWWSHYGASKNKSLIEEAGFAIILDEIDTTGGEKHQVILAQKKQLFKIQAVNSQPVLSENFYCP